MALTLLTWNVWFSQATLEVRARGVFSVCRARRPDVLCFQEVTKPFLQLLQCEDWAPAYRCSDPGDGSTFDDWYGTVMLVREPLFQQFAQHKLPTQMGRRLVTSTVSIGQERVTIGTVHLESLETAPLRAKQRVLCRQLLQHDHLAVLCGDFNFDSERNWLGYGPLENDELAVDLPGYRDVWPTLRGQEPGKTYDSVANPIIHHKDEQMRYDRVCYKGDQLVPRSIELVGTNPLIHPEYGLVSDTTDETERAQLSRLCPSDHFGLFAVFDVAPAVDVTP
eukprot:EG_transcript_16309